MVGNMWLGSVLGGGTGKNPGEILERRDWVASWEFKSEKMGGVKRVRGKVPGWGTPLWTGGWGYVLLSPLSKLSSQPWPAPARTTITAPRLCYDIYSAHPPMYGGLGPNYYHRNPAGLAKTPCKIMWLCYSSVVG